MNASPDAAAVRRFLARASRRLVVRSAIEGATWGLLAAGVVALVMAPATSIMVAATIAGLAVSGAAARVVLGNGNRSRSGRQLHRVATEVERRSPGCRNLLVTSAELQDGRASTPTLRDLVHQRAATLVDGIDLSGLVPMRVPLIVLTAALAVAVTAATVPVGLGGTYSSGSATTGAVLSLDQVEVIVAPPPHAGLKGDTLVDPTRIDVLEGSLVHVRVRASARSVRLERVAGATALTRTGDLFTIALVASDNDFLALTALGDTSQRGPARLIALAVTPDREPALRITAPARDLFFTTVPETLGVAIEAEDDLGLASLALRYTWVSGSGEQFTFTEREVPITINRRDGRSWSARATWHLDALRLSTGDMVVYRAEATDRRPGAVPVRSDSYVLEVTGPGAVAAEGFATDDERDRYAVSQQMVILKTERLIAARSSLPVAAVRDSAQRLAAEQRRVRAEFVFMMGGEVEDDETLSGTLMVNEEAESESETDLLAGRMQNRGRVEMMRAIRAMSRAASALTETDLPRALADERVALDNLLRAFSRSRVLLRALTRRERLDLDRRLSGALGDVASDERRVPEAPDQVRLAALRAVLVDLSEASTLPDPVLVRQRVSAGAVAVMRVAAGDDSLRAVAAELEVVARSGEPAAGAERVVLKLAGLLRELVPLAPPQTRSLSRGRLQGALADRLHGVPGRGGSGR